MPDANEPTTAAPNDDRAFCGQCGREAEDASLLPGAYDEECPAGAPCKTAGASIDDLRKIVIAANPWPLMAAAQRRGVTGIGFFESNYLTEDKVYVLDLDAMRQALDASMERLGARLARG